MSVYDRWHLSRPPAGAKTCGKHKGKVPSGEHGTGLRWQVRGTDDRGMPVKRSFEYEEDARQYDAELKAAVRAGTYVDDRAGRITFQQYAEDWRHTKNHGHATAERLERSLRNNCYSAPGTPGKTPQGCMAIGDYPMSVLSRRVSLMRDWIKDLPLQTNTALLLIGTVKAIFKAAVDDRIIPRNPLEAESVKKPKNRRREEPSAWTVAQVSAVAAGMPERLAAMVWLGASTGMRQGELFGVAVEDIDFLRRTVRVEAQVVQLGTGLAFGPVKNRTKRTVPVSRHVVPLLSQHVARFRPVPVTLPWSDREDKKMDGQPVTRTLLFPDDRGPWFKQTVNRHWRSAWQSAGIPDAGRANGMHVLRHTAASTWLSHGLNPAKVAAWLGDTVAIVLKTYAHWLPADDDFGREIMDRFLAPEAGSGASVCPADALPGS